MRLVGPEILIYLLYKCNARHLLFSFYQSNASHFLFSLDHCNARLLLFSLVQDCVMATTSCFHYNKTVWCQLPLILLYRITFECSPYSFQENIYRDVKDLRSLRSLRKRWETPFLDRFVTERMAEKLYRIHKAEVKAGVNLLWNMVKFQQLHFWPVTCLGFQKKIKRWL